VLLPRGRESWLRVCAARDRADQPPVASPAAVAARDIPGWAIVSAGLTPLVLTGGWLVAGLIQPAAYSPMRQTMSVMAGYSGHDRWVMEGVLLAVGGCYLTTAAGLACLGRPAQALLAVAGVCSVGIAASPVSPGGPTATHLAWTVLGAVTLAVWPVVARPSGPAAADWGSRADPAAIGARWSFLVSAAFLAMLGWVLVETQFGGMLGLAERLATSAESAWPFVVALVLRRAAGGVGVATHVADEARLSV